MIENSPIVCELFDHPVQVIKPVGQSFSFLLTQSSTTAAPNKSICVDLNNLSNVNKISFKNAAFNPHRHIVGQNPAIQGQDLPNSFQDFIRISLPVATVYLFSTWQEIPDS
jgi:hypothetical protein